MSAAAPKLLVLQHIACEPPGAYEDELLARGGEIVRVEVDEGERLPDWREFDGIIAMGGPMGPTRSNGFRGSPMRSARSRRPWPRAAILGSRASARSCSRRASAPVSPPAPSQSGRAGGRATRAGASDPVFSRLPARFHALQWHSDTFALPYGAILLARSSAYEHQAFIVNRAYALQFPHRDRHRARGRLGGGARLRPGARGDHGRGCAATAA